jgi:hypothetical protein
MGAQSPTEFNAGSHGFLQNTFNVDVSKKLIISILLLVENGDLSNIK